MYIGQDEERRDGLVAGVVVQGVDGAELLPYFVEHGLDFAALGDIGLDGDGAPSFAADPLGDVLGFIGAGGVVDRDIGALLGEHLGNPAADSAARSGDERYLTF